MQTATPEHNASNTVCWAHFRGCALMGTDYFQPAAPFLTSPGLQFAASLQLWVTRSSKNFINASLGMFNVFTTPRTSAFHRVLRKSLHKVDCFILSFNVGYKRGEKSPNIGWTRYLVEVAKFFKDVVCIVGVTIVYTHNHKLENSLRWALKRVRNVWDARYAVGFGWQAHTGKQVVRADAVSSPAQNHCPNAH